MNGEMTWYVVDCTFHSTIASDVGRPPLVERTLFLLKANSLASARHRAEIIAKSKEHSYLNADNQSVNWSFVEIADIREMIDQVFEDGTVVISWFSGEDDDEPSDSE